MAIQGLSSFLENYWCRNQVFRTVQFASGMISGLLERSYPDVAGKLMIVSGSISEMRVMLRLLDDLPALAYNLQNWKPKKVARSFPPVSMFPPSFINLIPRRSIVVVSFPVQMPVSTPDSIMLTAQVLDCNLMGWKLLFRTCLLVRQEVHTFLNWQWTHSCTSLYLDTDATQLALNPTVSL